MGNGPGYMGAWERRDLFLFDPAAIQKVKGYYPMDSDGQAENASPLPTSKGKVVQAGPHI